MLLDYLENRSSGSAQWNRGHREINAMCKDTYVYATLLCLLRLKLMIKTITSLTCIPKRLHDKIPQETG